ncbi:hypothetical protein GCM10027448_35380 [Nocardioides dilutus]
MRAAAAAYHGGVAGQYALTDSTTMGLGLMYGGLSLARGGQLTRLRWASARVAAQ